MLPDLVGGPTISTSTGTATAVPSPAAALDCVGLVRGIDLELLVGAPLPAASSPAGGAAVSVARGPFGVVAAGGAWCRWGDDTTAADVDGLGRMHAFSVVALPGAKESWSRLAELYANAATPGAAYDGGESRGGDCTVSQATSQCRTNVLVGGTWLAVEAFSGDSIVAEKDFHDAVQAMLPAVARFDASARPTTGAPLPCVDDAWLTELARVFELPTVSSLGVEETFRVQDALLVNRGITYCSYQRGDDGSGGFLGSVSVLPGGAAGFPAYRELVLAGDSSAHGGSIRHGGQDVATLVHSTPQTASQPGTTVVDAVVGDTWIQFVAQSADDDAVTAAVQWVADRLII